MSRPPSSEPVDAVVAVLAASRKYRHLAPAVLERVARESLAIEHNIARAADRARRKLHQIHSSFVTDGEFARAERLFDALGPSPTDAEIQAACREILRCHASTRERLGALESLHHDLFAMSGTNAPESLLDLGAGLHPFALPWMGLARDAHYVAWDLDGRALALVGRFFRLVGQKGEMRCADLLGDLPLPRADVALLFKLLPTLERQQAGAAARLLDRIDARVVVLSFPTASLGRRARGLVAGHRRLLDDLLPTRGFAVHERRGPRETFHVLTRQT